MDTEHEPQEEYSFIQETIKEEAFHPRKLAEKLGIIFLFGIVFGCAACIAFFALKPWAEETFQREPSKVELDAPEEDESDESESSGEEKTEVIEVDRELTIDDYSELIKLLNEVTEKTKKSVVTLSGIINEDELMTGRELQKSTAGVIVADNGRELLILGKYSSMKDMELYRVEFVDGAKHQATLKQKDVNLDMAIFSVAKDELENKTQEAISIAKLGSSTRLTQGMPLLAVGQPFGHEDGAANGVVSSYGESVLLADGEYGVFATDMMFDENASGILVDIYGNVMGIIDGDLGKSQDTSTMMAYAISEIKSEIEMMSNGQHVPYAGIIGVMVSEEISELRGIPAGLYVRETEKDSPAMAAGIQSGDVILEVGGTEITSIDVYHKKLYELEAGEAVKFKCQRLGKEGYVDISFTVTIGIK